MCYIEVRRALIKLWYCKATVSLCSVSPREVFGLNSWIVYYWFNSVWLYGSFAFHCFVFHCFVSLFRCLFIVNQGWYYIWPHTCHDHPIILNYSHLLLLLLLLLVLALVRLSVGHCVVRVHRSRCGVQGTWSLVRASLAARGVLSCPGEQWSIFRDYWLMINDKWFYSCMNGNVIVVVVRWLMSLLLWWWWWWWCLMMLWGWWLWWCLM